MADFLKDTVIYKERQVEIIKVIFALAFNLNITALYSATVDVEKKSSSSDLSFYRMNLGYKRYFLYIDKDLNIGGTDTSDFEKSAPYATDLRPVSNQVKIAYFLTHNNLVPDIIRENMEVI